jgi:ATP-dependent helicase/nuclease subunit A
VYRTYLSKSIFWKEFYEELLYAMIDALNMLYVAFTRSKEELIILAPADDAKTGKPSTVADLLYDSIQNPIFKEGLVDLTENYHKEEGIYELKNDYFDIDGDKYLKQPIGKSTFSISEFSDGNWNSKISIRDHAGEFFKESIEYIKAHIDYGTLMHEIFSRIDKTKSIDNLIDEFYYAGKISSEDCKELSIKINEMISRPQVADWFTDKWEVKTEEAILDISGKIRIPDRVLVGDNQTLVIDFKFGEKHSEYVSQVSDYMDLLIDMGYENVKGIIYYAEKNIIEEVN